MLKRILSGICTLSIAVSCMVNYSVYAEDTDLTSEIKLLQSLGVLTEGYITNDNFIYSLAGFLYDDPQGIGSAKDIALMLGFDITEEYIGNKRVTYDEAVKYAVITMGYGELAETRDKYKSIAADTGITKGITAEWKEMLGSDDAVRLLYNMIDAAPMVRSLDKSEPVFEVLTDETLLSFNRDITEINGLMTANEYTSVYGQNRAGTNSIIIDGNEYYISDETQNEYIGKNVTAYVQGEDNDDKVVLYIGERKNKNDILVIAAEDIENVADDYSQIKYVDNGRYRFAELDEVPRVIFNGMYYGEYTIDDLTPDIGGLELIDNDRDGQYEVIVVTSYTTMVAAAVDAEAGKISNKLNFDDCKEILELDGDDIIYTAFKNNEKVKLSSIKTGDILSVAESKSNGTKLVRIYAAENEGFSGTVTSLIPDENEISINGNIYNMSDDFKKYLANKSVSLSVGTAYKFYTDYFGSIAYIEFLINSEYKLVARVRMEEDGDRYFAEYMDLNEEWTKSYFAKKVKIDDDMYSEAAAYNELSKYDNNPQVMIIKLNSAGEIRSIDRAEETSQSTEGKFTKTPVASYVYRSEPNCFGMKIFLNERAMMFVIPDGAVKSKEDYYVMNVSGAFSPNTSYSISAYDIDDYGFTNLITMVRDSAYEKSSVRKTMFIVTKVFKELYDGEAVHVIQGNMGEYKNMTVTAANANVFDGISKGDVLNLSVNRKGEATYVKKLVSLEAFSPISAGSTYESTVVIAGNIEEIDAENRRIKINTGSSVVVKIGSGVSVQVYDSEMKSCETKTVAELNKGDKVALKVNYGVANEIVSVK